jgi:hypothetical protein
MRIVDPGFEGRQFPRSGVEALRRAINRPVAGENEVLLPDRRADGGMQIVPKQGWFEPAQESATVGQTTPATRGCR